MNGGAYFSPNCGEFGSNSLAVSSSTKPTMCPAIGASVKRKKLAAGVLAVAQRHELRVAERALLARVRPRHAGEERELVRHLVQRADAERRRERRVVGARRRRRRIGRSAITQRDSPSARTPAGCTRRRSRRSCLLPSRPGSRAGHDDLARRTCRRAAAFADRPRLDRHGVSQSRRSRRCPGCVTERVAAVEHAGPHLVEVAQAVEAVRGLAEVREHLALTARRAGSSSQLSVVTSFSSRVRVGVPELHAHVGDARLPDLGARPSGDRSRRG